MEDKNIPIEEMTFKQASQQLELIVRKLETGDLELEESLEEYSRGVALLKSLQQRLKDAEQKVEELVHEADDYSVDTVDAPAQAYLNE